jgi:hypothetical protein
MPRIGLVRFAAVALDVARAVVPDYRAPRSKHVFTQPQLLAVLCLMRYDDWTFRDAEIRLAEHAELRAALQLTRVPDHTTLWRFLDRVPLAVLQDLLAEVLRRCAPPSGPRGGRRRAVVAVDATGLATGSVSTYFERRRQELTGQPRSRAHWLKWLVALDVDRQLILAQTAHRGPGRDTRTVAPLLAGAPAVQALVAAGQLGWVVADREFDAEALHAFVATALHARAVIPAIRARYAADQTPLGPRTPYRARLAARGLPAVYRRRALVETLFSTVKRTQGGTAPGRRLDAQIKQAHLVGISYDLARLEQLSARHAAA